MLETITSWLDSNWFSLLIGAYIVGMVLYGHSRGFVRLAISCSAVLITAFAAKSALPQVADYLNHHTEIESALEDYIVKSSGMDTLSGREMDTKEDQSQIIAGLRVPESVQTLLDENNRGEIWERLGVRQFQQYVAGYLSRMMIGYIGFALLFLIIWAFLQILLKIVDHFTELPVIHGLNQISGAVLGLMEALVFVWMFFMILGLFEGTTLGRKLLILIQDSLWLNLLYQNNLVAFFLRGLVTALL